MNKNKIIFIVELLIVLIAVMLIVLTIVFILNQIKLTYKLACEGRSDDFIIKVFGSSYNCGYLKNPTVNETRIENRVGFLK